MVDYLQLPILNGKKSDRVLRNACAFLAVVSFVFCLGITLRALLGQEKEFCERKVENHVTTTLINDSEEKDKAAVAKVCKKLV
jgi:hypothetical protein